VNSTGILLTKNIKKYVPEEKVHNKYFNMMETHWILIKYFLLFNICQECSKTWSVFTVLHLEISRLKFQLA